MKGPLLIISWSVAAPTTTQGDAVEHRMITRTSRRVIKNSRSMVPAKGVCMCVCVCVCVCVDVRATQGLLAIARAERFQCQALSLASSGVQVM
jgi:hypothetical protein